MRGQLLLPLSILAIVAATDPARYTDGHQYVSFNQARTEEIALWPDDQVPGERAGVIGPEVYSCLSGGPVSKCQDIATTNVTVPTLTPFLVPGSDSAMLVAPGGAYRGLAIAREGTDIAAWLNSIGVSAYVLKVSCCTCTPLTGLLLGASTGCQTARGCRSVQRL